MNRYEVKYILWDNANSLLEEEGEEEIMYGSKIVHASTSREAAREVTSSQRLITAVTLLEKVDVKA